MADEECIIKYSIKFMRILNSHIVDAGTKYNSEDRVVYRGVNYNVLKDAKVGEIYRIITWSCTSENLSTAQSFSGGEAEANSSTLLKFCIKKRCFNAGRINYFGKSCYPNENETLIPPYSAVNVVEHRNGYLELELARDNKTLDFSMKTIH